MSLADIPEIMRQLPNDIVHALKPIDADPGMHTRNPNGYRVHTDMTRLVWRRITIEDQIAQLPARFQVQARNVFDCLMASMSSA